jgi:PTH1 family peptidyl-tRNA hydrolase
VLGHVLGDFSRAEQEPLTLFLDAVTDAAPLLAAGDESAFMNRVALLTQPPKPGRQSAAPAG